MASMPKRGMRILVSALVVLSMLLSTFGVSAQELSGADLLKVKDVSVTAEPSIAGEPAKYTVQLTLGDSDLSSRLPDPDYVEILFPPEVRFLKGYGWPGVGVNNKTGSVLIGDVGDLRIAGPLAVEIVPNWPGYPAGTTMVRVRVMDDIVKGSVVQVVFLYDGFGGGPDFGLGNPLVPGTYPVLVSTSEEVEKVRADLVISDAPVKLSIKYVIPEEDCCQEKLFEYKWYASIQDALDTANRLYTGNLCPIEDPALPAWIQDVEAWPWPLYSQDPLYTDAGVLQPPCGPITRALGIQIDVAPGVYAETLFMDTPGVALIGHDAVIDATGLDPDDAAVPGARLYATQSPWYPFGKNNSVIEIVASGTTVTGFTIVNGGKGVTPQAGEGDTDWDADGNEDVHGIEYYPWNPKGGAIVYVNEDGEGLQRVASSPLNFSSTGWGGWSCPAGTLVLGGGYEPDPSSYPVAISQPAKPGVGTYPNYPHYNYTPPEEGWVVQNGGTGQTLTVYAICGNGTRDVSLARVNITSNVIAENSGVGVMITGTGTIMAPSGFTFDGETHTWRPEQPREWGIQPAVVLVSENQIHDNVFDGIYAEGIGCGVETWDPMAYTHGWFASTEFIANAIFGNGYSTTDQDDWVEWWYAGDADWEWWEVGAGLEIASSFNCPGGPAILQGDNGPEPHTWQWDWEGCKIYIADNDINQNTDKGIALQGEAAQARLVITQNKIWENAFAGISNAAYTATGPTGTEYVNVLCIYNDFARNVEWAIKNWVTNPEFVQLNFNAKENWFDSVGGPSKGNKPPYEKHSWPDQTSMALGNGNAVSHWVLYSPWLSAPFAAVVPGVGGSGANAFGSDTLALQTGWNTFSVPTALNTLADTTMDIAGLGEFLTADNFQVAYKYEGGIYNLLIGTDALRPLRGYLFKMLAPTRMPVVYWSEESVALPSYGLIQGWNLVGSGFGIDRNDEQGQGRWAVAAPGDDIEGQKAVQLALDSVADQASVIVSPSVPGQIAAWSASYQTAENRVFFVGEAYWLFMRQAGILAGYEVTPFYNIPPFQVLP